MSASEQAAWFVTAAARAYGSQALAAAGDAGTAGAEAALGRDLLRLLAGGSGSGRELPAPVAAVIARPGSGEALNALDVYLEEALEQDAALAAAVEERVAGFFREQLESGDGQVLADLGHLLWWDDPQQARAAFERAIAAGNEHALIDLAKLRHAVLDDPAAALLGYQQAAGSADPDVAAEALLEIGHLQAIVYRDALAAQAAYQQVIGMRHPRWSPEAMIDLGYLLHWQLGDDDGAQAMFQQAIDSGNADSRARSLARLADVLDKRGDRAGAKDACWQAIDSRAAPWAEIAFSHLVNLLEPDGDVGGLRAAHRAGVETGNPGAPHALVAIGNLLREQGDTEGWRAAWQQAIETGYGAADDLREIMFPPAEDDDDLEDDGEQVDLPPQFDPKNTAQTGTEVLNHGLPPLPDVLTYQMAIPVAYWTATHRAVVLFLRFSRHGRDRDSVAVMVTFSREQGQWQAGRDPSVGTGWGHDPIANPGDLRELDGRAMTISGGSSAGRWPASAAHRTRPGDGCVV